MLIEFDPEIGLYGCSYVLEIVKWFHGTPLIDPQPLRKR